MTREERADRLRPLLKSAVDETSLRQVAAAVGVSHTAIQDFIGRSKPPSERTISKVERWLRQREADTTELEVFAAGPGGEPRSAGVIRDGQWLPAAEWLQDVERVVRLASTKENLDEAERLALKKDILNTYIDARKQRNAPVPPVLYEMLGRVERGDL